MKRTIEISEETWNKIKDQVSGDEAINIKSYDDLIGRKFFVRTVTYHLVGEVVGLVGKLVQLKDASWVAVSGRFMNCIKNGDLQEVEPVGDAFFNLDAVVDMFPWKHALPTAQK